MKNAIQKLFSLLGKCSEDDDKATRLKLLASITLSSDYKELSQAVAFKKPFEENYSIPILETLDISTLIQRKKILHKLVAFHSKLLQSIRFGNGPELSSKDLPDFTSSSSLTKTLKTIRLSNVPTNYSNISDETALELFSDNSVKSARECLERLPVSLTSHETISEEEINKAMGNTYYCVSIEEFKKVHREFLSFFSKGEQIVLDERILTCQSLFNLATL